MKIAENKHGKDLTVFDIAPDCETTFSAVMIAKRNNNFLSPSLQRKCERIKRALKSALLAQLSHEIPVVQSICPGIDAKDISDEYFAMVCRHIMQNGNMLLDDIVLEDHRQSVARKLCGISSTPCKI